GQYLALGILLFGAYLVVDLLRPHPMLNLHWLGRPFMLRFMLAVVLFRVGIAEQATGVVGLMTVLGQSNEQMPVLFTLARLATFAGFLIAAPIALRFGPRVLSVVAALPIIVAAFMDSSSTSLTRPEQLYFTQSLLSIGLILFISAAALLGFVPVLAEGGRHLVSFLAAFSAAQSFATPIGTAFIQTFVAARIPWHFAALVQPLPGGDPAVVARLQQMAGGVGRFLNAPAARVVQGVSRLAGQVLREASV